MNSTMPHMGMPALKKPKKITIKKPKKLALPKIKRGPSPRGGLGGLLG